MSHVHPDEADKYVALVSGLGIGGGDFKPLELDLLAEYLTGEIGSTKVRYGMICDTIRHA